MANKEKAVAEEKKDVMEEIGTKPAEQVKKVRPHKILVYWKENRILRVCLGAGRHVTFFPGYNTIDDADLPVFYKENRYYITKGKLVAKGVSFKTDESGKVTITDDLFLLKCNANTLNEIMRKTVSKKTLEDLSNPDFISPHYVDIASRRIREIEDTQADTTFENNDMEEDDLSF